ncbi:hypothetical protein FNV43_RR08113 [Rhamnella rubrinervis]|uniref:G protein gamma domain-containing protein n=1 Tax=Rhamnella rubrinervis TaxID=2594499 RepID=A0A8K0MMZ2_9ROSA|nr:hypothetical protein FNV43_RR08113 [Rhamnella rubrinervis]
MEGRCNSSSSLSSTSSFGSGSALRATSPKSPPPPPPGFDLYGKRRQVVKLQVLEREIGLLQEELKSLDGLQPASRSCKELDAFIGAKQDPFIAKYDFGMIVINPITSGRGSGENAASTSCGFAAFMAATFT